MDLKSRKTESGTESGHSLEFDFVVPPPHSRAHSTTASCSTIQKQLRGWDFCPSLFLNPFLTRPIFLYFLVDKLEEALYTDSAGYFFGKLD